MKTEPQIKIATPFRYGAALIPFFFLISCSQYPSKTETSVAGVQKEISIPKQKSRIAQLEKKLEEALKGVAKAELEAERYRSEIQEARLFLISKQLDLYERQIEETLEDPTRYNTHFQEEMGGLFLKEREELDLLIRSGAPVGAQALLDRILRLITQLSDDTRPLPQ